MATRIRANYWPFRCLFGLAGGLCISLAALAGNPLPDPTRPAYRSTEPGTTAPEVTYSLQSILQSPDRALAIINGQRVTIGDRVGGARVITIRPGEVIVDFSGKRQTLHLNPSAQVIPLNSRSMSPPLLPAQPPQPSAK